MNGHDPIEHDDPVRSLLEAWERDAWTPERDARVRGNCLDLFRRRRSASPSVLLIASLATFLGASSLAAVALLLANAAAGAALAAVACGSF